MNRPIQFAEVYVRENNLPNDFASIISTQIEQQINLHLQKRLKNFCQLYEPKANESPLVLDNPDEKRKIDNSIQLNPLCSLILPH